ncbi:ATP-binding protein [Pseudomonas abietaniphila]
MDSKREKVYEFGPFRLCIRARRLEKDGVPLAVGSRALDLLIALVLNAGQVVDKRDLMAHAWQKIVVDESNLRVTIASLRKALGEREDGVQYIANISGRGYSFTAKVQSPLYNESTGSNDTLKLDLSRARSQSRRRMLGRDEEFLAFTTFASQHRLITISGAPGIGKSVLVRTYADYLSDLGSTRVIFFDLDSLTIQPEFIKALEHKLCASMECPHELAPSQTHSEPYLLTVVFDNCDSYLDVLARTVAVLTGQCPFLQIIFTSREALHLPGERVFTLGALNTGVILTADDTEPDHSAAVEVFLDASLGACQYFDPAGYAESRIDEICQRLDGHPLAILIAAARVRTLGLNTVLKLVRDRQFLSWTADRTVIGRHQNLSALIDSSILSLTDPEKAFLLYFTNNFRCASVKCLLESCADGEHSVMINALDSVVSKSLITALLCDDGTMQYQMSAILRLYCQDLVLPESKLCFRKPVAQRQRVAESSQ